MLLAHLTVAGFVELALTAGVVAYLQRANLPLLRLNHPGVPDEATDDAARPLGWRALVGGLGVLAVLTPIGLLAPGAAFGEDRPADLDLARYHLDAVPRGLARYAGFWHHALFDGYDFTGDRHPVLGYLVSAGVGAAVIAAVVLVVVLATRRLARP
jgi:cobalt/nickel transport system permease protein